MTNAVAEWGHWVRRVLFLKHTMPHTHVPLWTLLLIAQHPPLPSLPITFVLILGPNNTLLLWYSFFLFFQNYLLSCHLNFFTVLFIHRHINSFLQLPAVYNPYSWWENTFCEWHQGWQSASHMVGTQNVASIQPHRGGECQHLRPGWTWGHYAEWNKPVTKVQMLYDSMCLRYLEYSNSQKQELKCWLPGIKGRRKKKRSVW